MSHEGNSWGDKFNDKAASSLAAFMSTYNVASQTVAFADENCATTGLQPCCINGVYIPILPVEDDADWSETTATTSIAGDAKGHILYDAYEVYLAIFANSLGRLRIDLAGENALDADVELKIPWFDPTTWCCIGIALINAAATTTLGSTNLSALDTVYQVIGPVLPHPDNLKI